MIVSLGYSLARFPIYSTPQRLTDPAHELNSLILLISDAALLILVVSKGYNQHLSACQNLNGGLGNPKVITKMKESLIAPIKNIVTVLFLAAADVLRERALQHRGC
jgi:hypothetical protein